MRNVIMGAAGIAGLAVAAFVLLKFGPSRIRHRELPEATRNQPTMEGNLDSRSGGENDRSSAEGPAAKLQAELYGIAESLVERLPNSPRAHCLLASVHRRFAREAEEARALKQCLALDPMSPEAHYSFGMMAIRAGRYSEAEEHFRNAFRADPGWADLPLQLARAQMSQNKFHDAISTLDTYLESEPADAEAWCHLGQAYQKSGDHARAKRCHLKAIELDPNVLEAHYGAAKAMRELGESKKAREYFEKFREMRSSMTTSVRSNKAAMQDEDFVRAAVVSIAQKAGAVYAMHGYPAEAEECWIRATTLDPSNTECLKMLCRLRPNNPELWLKLGQAYLQDGRPEEAESALDLAIEMDPDNPRCREARAKLREGRDP